MIDHRSILKQNADHLVQRGKGILAADEDSQDLTQRFQTIGIENNVEQRRIYRQILFTTENIEKYLSGILMHEETFDQTTDSSQGFPLVLSQLGILPGIKLDRVKRQRSHFVLFCSVFSPTPTNANHLFDRVYSRSSCKAIKRSHWVSMIWINEPNICENVDRRSRSRSLFLSSK